MGKGSKSDLLALLQKMIDKEKQNIIDKALEEKKHMISNLGKV